MKLDIDIKAAEEEMRQMIDNIKNELAETIRNYLRLGSEGDRLDDLTSKLDTLTDRLNDLEEAVKQGPRLDEPGEFVRDFQQRMDDISNGENEKSLRRKVDEISVNVSKILEMKDGEYQKLLADAAQLPNLQEKLRKAEDDRDKNKKDLESTAAELNSANSEKNRLSGELANVQNQLNQKNINYNNLDGELVETKKSLDMSEANLKVVKESLEKKELELVKFRATESALEAWRKKAAVYAPIRDAMKSCPVFKDFLQSEVVDSDEETELFTLAQAMGKTMDFPKAVHQWAKGYKKDNLNSMEEDEIAVYQALNAFYRQLWKVESDIFTMPGRTPVTDGIQMREFKRDESDNFPDPKKQMSKIQEVYVPLLLDKDGKKVSLAQVKTSNL